MANNRGVKSQAVTIAAGAAVSSPINVAQFAAGMVIMPGTWTAADLGVKVCGAPDGTFVPLKDLSNAYGTDVSIDGPVASTAYILPLHIFAAEWVQLWSHNGSGSDTNQAAARTLIVFLKP